MATIGRRRALGQHFLRDARISETIASTAVDLARETGCDGLLEIGPGRGAITRPLLRFLSQGDAGSKPSRFLLIERDERLATAWASESRGEKPTFTAKAGRPIIVPVDGVDSSGRAPRSALLPRDEGVAFPFDVETADFNVIPESKWLPSSGNLGVVSNLPYSAGTAIFTRLAAMPERIPVMVLMFQAEVAQRLRAVRGTKDWGSLSVWTQNRWDVERLISVPPGAFVPPPDVQSEVVVVRARAEPRIPIDFADPADVKLWDLCLKTAFAHRRKMLRSGLPGTGHWKKALEASGIDGTKRAESLDWDEWRRFYESLRSLRA